MACLPAGPDAFFSVGPAETGKAQCFAIKRGEIDGRIDVNYWWLTPSVDRRLKNSRFDVKSLGSLLSLVQYGCSSLAKENQPGIPILRMNNLQDDGWDLSSLKYIELGERELATYRLIPGDILFNRTNSKELVGKCSVFHESGDWVFASYLIRVRTDQGRLLPQFASDFLAADIGRLQIDQISRQIIGMTNINAEEIRELRIPLPAIAEQHRLVAAMDTARAGRKSKLAEADALLAGLDNFVLDALGITQPDTPKSIFAVRTRDLADVINPDRYRSLQIEKMLPFQNTVGDVVSLIEEKTPPAKGNPEQQIDLIRIDDLPNQPWQVDTVRTELGKNLGGVFFDSSGKRYSYS